MRSRWAALILAMVAVSAPSAAHAAAAKSAKSTPADKGAKKASASKGESAASRQTAARSEKRDEGESAELRMLREMDAELFPQGSRFTEPDLPWPLPQPKQPTVHATGLLPEPPIVESVPQGERDLSWLRELELPDWPARWDARVIRYLEYYRNNPRGRSFVAMAIKRSGRYAPIIRETLREQGLPEDLMWAALVESAFNPTARSHAGAAGLWQFMPGTARIYGLTVDKDIDERLDPIRATEAAARHLGDLYRRFGSWELSLAAYNMGYGGLLSAIRKFNTNDFFELGRYEAGIPWETTLYVPKIIAMAIVARNPAVFGHEGIELDPPIEADAVRIPGGTTLKAIARAAGITEADLAALNPQIRGTKLPSGSGDEKLVFTVYVPPGKGPEVAKRFNDGPAFEGKLERYVVRFGDSVESVAKAFGTTTARLVEMNGLREGETLRARTAILVPQGRTEPAGEEEKTVVVVPPIPVEEEGKRRVFYRVLPGDGLFEIARAFGVLPDDLRRWNSLDLAARLQDGMTLQILVPEDARLDHVAYLEESQARVLVAGSEEFFAHFEGLRGRKRAVIAVQAGDTWQKIGQRYGLTLGQLERINRRSRREELKPGETVVVYVPAETKVAEVTPEQGPAALPPIAEVEPVAVEVEVAPAAAETPEPEAKETTEGSATEDPALAANPNEEVEL